MSPTAEKVVTDLKNIIHQHDLDLKQIFSSFDKDKSGTLDLNEFGLML